MTLLPCPPVGHKTFERSVKTLQIGEVTTPYQISKFIRPASCMYDAIGLKHPPGKLQEMDYAVALSMFAYPQFIRNVFIQHKDLFQDSECRVYQFQTMVPSGAPFIFGLFITDGLNNLVNFCVESRQPDRRRAVLIGLMRAICTASSLNKRLAH